MVQYSYIHIYICGYDTSTGIEFTNTLLGNCILDSRFALRAGIESGVRVACYETVDGQVWEEKGLFPIRRNRQLVHYLLAEVVPRVSNRQDVSCYPVLQASNCVRPGEPDEVFWDIVVLGWGVNEMRVGISDPVVEYEGTF